MSSVENLPPDVSTLGLQHLSDTELSLRARLGYVVLLLVGLVAAGAIGSLWLTEPSLPRRTHIAFALMVSIGLAWAVFALRVLTSRRILLARHRIIAARMSVAFTSLFLLGSLAIGYVLRSAAALAAAGTGAVLLMVAIWTLLHAHRRLAKLMKRRDVLARELGRKV